MTTLSIGKSLYSITIKTEGYPVENSKSTVNEKMESSGGTALVVSYLLGKWQVDSYFAGTVGYDDYANSIKKDLESVNTHTTFLETNYEKKTTQSLILSNKVNKSKTEQTKPSPAVPNIACTLSLVIEPLPKATA